MRLHNPRRCSICQSLKRRVETGDVICFAGGSPCDLCLATHRSGLPT